MDLTEPGRECGEKWHGWLAKYDPDSCSWKTPQCSLLGEEQESLATLPRWGMTANGLLWEQPTLEPITRGTGFGYSLPTPTCNPHLPNKNANTKGPKNLMEIAEGKWEHLMPQKMWPTPRTAGICGGMGSWKLLNKNTTKEEARKMGAGNGGKLNPTWVEWLMGWPLGWTDLKPLVTDKSHCVQQKPGDC